VLFVFDVISGERVPDTRACVVKSVSTSHSSLVEAVSEAEPILLSFAWRGLLLFCPLTLLVATTTAAAPARAAAGHDHTREDLDRTSPHHH
jgi:hypothetical protein